MIGELTLVFVGFVGLLAVPGNWRSDNYCAVNSLYAFLRMKDVDVSYQNVCDSTTISEQGTSLFELSEASQRLGFALRPLKLTPSELEFLDMPSIVLMEGVSGVIGHYVIVFNINKDNCSVLDCSSATQLVMSRGEFERQWSGYAMVPPDAHQLYFWIVFTILIAVGIMCFVLKIPQIIDLGRKNEFI